MKIGLLTSHRGQKEYEKEHTAIIQHLQEKGFDVVHSMATTVEHLAPLSYADRETIFFKFYQELEDCELIFAECSIQSVQVGFGMSHLRSKGKPIVVFSIQNSMHDLSPKGETYSNAENMMAYAYTYETVGRVINEALDYMEPHVDKRFTMVFPSGLFAKLEEISKKKKLPKAVYIRQLIEKSMALGE